MDADQVRKLFLDRLGIRLEPEMCRYVAGRIGDGSAGESGASIPVIGGDARTGVALRRTVPPELLTAVQS